MQDDAACLQPLNKENLSRTDTIYNTATIYNTFVKFKCVFILRIILFKNIVHIMTEKLLFKSVVWILGLDVFIS